MINFRILMYQSREPKSRVYGLWRDLSCVRASEDLSKKKSNDLKLKLEEEEVSR